MNQMAWQSPCRQKLARPNAGDAEQGPPRSEGVVPLPAQRSEARAGGRRAAPQGGALLQRLLVLRISFSSCHSTVPSSTSNSESVNL